MEYQYRSFIFSLITGFLVRDYGIGAFGIGGIGMLVALLIFRFYSTYHASFDSEVSLDSSWDLSCCSS